MTLRTSKDSCKNFFFLSTFGTNSPGFSKRFTFAMSSAWDVTSNDAYPLSNLVQIRQFQGLCTSLNTLWDTNGLYRSTAYTAVYPCPITPAVPIPGYHPSTTRDETQTQLPNSQLGGVFASSASQSSGSPKPLSAATTAAIILALVLAFSTLNFTPWWCFAKGSRMETEQRYREEERGCEDANRRRREGAERRCGEDAARHEHDHQTDMTHSSDSYHTAHSQQE